MCLKLHTSEIIAQRIPSSSTLEHIIVIWWRWAESRECTEWLAGTHNVCYIHIRYSSIYIKGGNTIIVAPMVQLSPSLFACFLAIIYNLYVNCSHSWSRYDLHLNLVIVSGERSIASALHKHICLDGGTRNGNGGDDDNNIDIGMQQTLGYTKYDLVKPQAHTQYITHNIADTYVWGAVLFLARCSASSHHIVISHTWTFAKQESDSTMSRITTANKYKRMKLYASKRNHKDESLLVWLRFGNFSGCIAR